MSFVFDGDQDNATSAIVRRTAQQGPTDFGENLEAAWKAGLNERTISRAVNLSAQYDPIVERLNEGVEDPGARLHNPYASDLDIPGEAPLFGEGPFRAPGTRSTPLTPEALEDQLWTEIQRRRAAGEDLSDLPQSRAEVRELALAKARAEFEEAERIGSTATPGGVAGQFLGGMGAVGTDPAIWPTFLVGAGSSAGILRTAVTEALIGGSTEAALQPIIAKYREDMGLDYTAEDFLRNVGFATGASGILGGTIRAAGKGTAALFDRMRSDRGAAEVFDEVVENPTAEQRAARADVEARADVDEAQPEADTGPRARADHHTRYTVADKAAREGRAPVMDEIPPDARAAAVRDPASGIERVNPDELTVDAQRFQFKAGATTEGVTERLQGVTRWDESKAGIAVVWERADGQQFVADGHQRVALARRLREQGQDIRLNAIVLRESEGISDVDARVQAAAKNIAEGSGSPVDAAKVLRDAGSDVADETLASLPPQSALVRQARGIANLSDDAFGAVVNELLPAHYGAIVGRLVDDPDLQRAITDLLIREEPPNAAQAESIVRQAREAGFGARATQEGLFGEEDVSQLLFRERAQILDRATRKLRQDKRAFRTLIDQAREIEGAGNRLATETNVKRAATDAEAIDLVTKLAHTRGPISDALGAAATRAQREGRFDRAVDDFLDAVRAAADRGDISRGDVRAGGRGGESARADEAVQEQLAGQAEADQQRLTAFDEPGGEGAQDQVAGLDADMRPRDQRAAAEGEEPARDQTETAEDELAAADVDVDDPEQLARLLTDNQELFDAANSHRAARGLEPFESPEQALEQLSADLDDMLERPRTVDTLDETTIRRRREDAIAHLAARGGLAEGEPTATIRADRRADIVLGAPASGKSSALVDPLARHHRSMVVDADEAKQLLPEYDGGRGANATHEESAEIVAELWRRQVAEGRNIVYPKVGRTREGIDEIMGELNAQGYQVYVHLVELPPAKTMQRMLLRYVSTGRLLPPDYVKSIGRTPRETYDATKGQAQGHSAVDNDVAPGESPRVVEQGGAEVLWPDVYPGSRAGSRFSDRPRDAQEPDQLTAAEEAEALELADMEFPVGERVDENGDLIAEVRTVREAFAEADADQRFADEVEACAQ